MNFGINFFDPIYFRECLKRKTHYKAEVHKTDSEPLLSKSKLIVSLAKFT